jgi:thiamine pyrophosphate-dependent acetolactate synthase large subunit-like protein
VNYGAVCGALGGRGEKVKSTHELQQALASLPRRGVTCIDIDLDGLVAPNFPD